MQARNSTSSFIPFVFSTANIGRHGVGQYLLELVLFPSACSLAAARCATAALMMCNSNVLSLPPLKLSAVPSDLMSNVEH